MTRDEAAGWLEKHLGKMHGWCSLEKAVRMLDAVVEVGHPLSVELGVFGGRSLTALALGHAVIGRGMAVGIDPYCAEASTEADENETNSKWWKKVDYFEIRKSAETWISMSGGPYRLVVDRSENVACGYREIGVLHIDGNHSEWVSTRDVLMWLPKVVDEGIVVMDDTTWESTATARRFVGKMCSVIDEGENYAIYRKDKKLAVGAVS